MSDRSALLNAAYRMLGSVPEAEDAVQEAYARWYAMSAQRREAVDSPTAWLVTTVSRICLDVLGSARHRRERYVGTWLPEPVSDAAAWASLSRDPIGDDPAELVATGESLSVAMLVVLETMTPAERVVFVLHDVFGFRFTEVADVVGRSAGACRQMASSARRRVRQGRRRAVGPGDHARAVSAFKAAWQTGDTEALIAVLDPDAHAVADGGGRVSAPLVPLHGAARIAAMFAHVHRKLPGLTIETAMVSGQAGLTARDTDGRIAAVVALAVAGGRVRDLWVMRNPEKLTTWRQRPSRR
ncbi:RNA polymerase sigma factor SigJ [Glycomyces tarimensis]